MAQVRSWLKDCRILPSCFGPRLLDQKRLKDLNHRDPTGVNFREGKKRGEALRTYQLTPGDESLLK